MKTVLQLILLFVSVIGLMCAEEIRLFKFHTSFNNSQFLCYNILNDALYFGVALHLIIFYLLMLYKHLVKHIPSMLKRIGLELVFALSAQLYHVILFLVNRIQLHTKQSLFLKFIWNFIWFNSSYIIGVHNSAVST